MSHLVQLNRLIDDVVELTRVERPPGMEEKAPTLDPSVIEPHDSEGVYLVGLIGGKDTGKSAMVNALVGREITPRTSHGPGTETVIAYAHERIRDRIAELLEREAPGMHRIVTHDLDALPRQALLDLPDIDSHYESHVSLTQRMLRHMLYPIWLQSVEKYADMKPKELLLRVAGGNSPRNFIFCLNKLDQLGEDAEREAEELREDYARRLADRLGLDEPPKVWLLSALNPDRFDLPELREAVMKPKSEEDVRESRRLALRRHGETVSRWLHTCGLEQYGDSLERLRDQTAEEIMTRVVQPLLTESLPALTADPAYRIRLHDPLLERRIARWPVLAQLHGLFVSGVWVLRRRLPLDQQRGMDQPEALVAAHLRADGRRPSQTLSALFARLHQAHPALARCYADKRLWEEAEADRAEADLRRGLTEVIEAQRASGLGISEGADNIGRRVIRATLTLGAIGWFPFVQPLLAELLRPAGTASLAGLVVGALGVDSIARNVLFLLGYFTALWALIKRDTWRRVGARVDSMATDETLSADLNPAARALAWTDSLLAPADAALERVRELRRRIAELPAPEDDEAA